VVVVVTSPVVGGEVANVVDVEVEDDDPEVVGVVVGEVVAPVADVVAVVAIVVED
jgi:hypothetical protein